MGALVGRRGGGVSTGQVRTNSMIAANGVDARTWSCIVRTHAPVSQG
jgi:hypothetical protein